jgi:hypothetical protein
MATHSITSSARASNESGKVKPSAFAFMASKKAADSILASAKQ